MELTGQLEHNTSHTTTSNCSGTANAVDVLSTTSANGVATVPWMSIVYIVLYLYDPWHFYKKKTTTSSPRLEAPFTNACHQQVEFANTSFGRDQNEQERVHNGRGDHHVNHTKGLIAVVHKAIGSYRAW